MGRHEKQGSRAQKNHLDLDLVSSVVAVLGSKFMCHTGGSKGFASSAGLTCPSPVMCCCGQSLPPPMLFLSTATTGLLPWHNVGAA